ncbi:hypothetical protein ACIRL2_35430 [Embleya sp. NPDC127516]|uniref:hypothetical protein n=1 Tax=Embleya sp. NPDC127516 TaxID=3363990 RepID=UPI00382B4A95
MPEDPIGRNEFAALTRLVEAAQAQNSREFGIVKSELTTLHLEVGNVDQKIDALAVEVRSGNARIIELLAGFIAQSKGPDAG